MLIGNEGKLSIETMDWVTATTSQRNLYFEVIAAQLPRNSSLIKSSNTDRSEEISHYGKAKKSGPYIAAVFKVDEDGRQVLILGDGKILF